MKKQLLFGLFAAVSMLCAATFTSCTEDEPTTSETTHIVLKKPAATHAIGDEQSILVIAVYDKNGNKIDNLSEIRDNAFQNGLEEKLSLRLVKGQEYTIACWAQTAACEAYDYSDLSNITIDYTKIAANSNASDAFFAHVDVTGNTPIENATITLKRPFAQINLAVDSVDYNSAIKAGTTIEKSKVVVATAGSAFSALTGKVTATTTNVTFDWATLPTDSLHTQLNDKDTTLILLSSNFILPNTGSGEASALADVTFTLQTNGNPIEFVSTSTPLQHNYRTNVIGSLTNPAEFTIVIEDEWATPDYSADPEKPLTIYDLIDKGGSVTINEGDIIGSVLNLEGRTIATDLHLYVNANLTEIKAGHANDTKVTISLADGIAAPEVTNADARYTLILADGVSKNLETGATEISSAKGLAYASANLFAQGGTFDITSDLDMTGVAYTTIQSSVNQLRAPLTINGNNHTISNLEVTGGTYGAFLGYVSRNTDINDLTIENSTFAAENNQDGEYSSAAFMAWVTEGSTVNLTNCKSINNTIGSAKYVGGLVGFFSSYDSKKITNCQVIGGTITSEYTEDGGAKYKGHCGGLVGASYVGTITNSTIQNTIITVKGDRGGAVVGSIIGGTTLLGEGIVVDNVTFNGAKATAANVCGSVNNTNTPTDGVTVQ